MSAATLIFPNLISHFLSLHFYLSKPPANNNQSKKAPMTLDRWVKATLTDDTLVANLLLRMKHSSDSDSLNSPSPTQIIETKALPPLWGNRKNRSKSTAPVTASKEQRGSPTTHLSWSSGGGSISDESSRPSDLSSGLRSVKSFFELKDQDGSLIKERAHINRELTSIRVNLHQQMATTQTFKKIKINYGDSPFRVEVEKEGKERGFVLPDLNMTPNEEDLMTMMS